MADQSSMAARFHELGRKKAEIQAAAAPHRAEYERMRAEECALRDRIKAVADRMKAIEAPLYAIDVERAQIARALGGKTGEVS